MQVALNELLAPDQAVLVAGCEKRFRESAAQPELGLRVGAGFGQRERRQFDDFQSSRE